ncbi:MAG: glycosyltransferase family 4 protein [Promethearchaeota archaeon]
MIKDETVNGCRKVKRKFLLIFPEWPPAIGGMQTHAICLSNYLFSNGHKILVVTYKPNHAQYSKQEYLQSDKLFNFPVIRILSRITYYQNLRIIQKISRKFKPDLIYSSNIFYGILKDWTGKPTVCRSVGNDILRPWIPYPFNFGSRLLYNKAIEEILVKIFFKYLRELDIFPFLSSIFRKRRLNITIQSARSADTILPNSHFTTRILVGFGVNSAIIKPIIGGVDVNFFRREKSIDKRPLRKKLNLPEDKILLLTVCRLVQKKRVDLLIRTIKTAISKDKNWHLVIIGNGKRRKKLIKLTHDLELTEFITFIGSIPYYSIPQYYWTADLFILASKIFYQSKTKTYDVETMGRVLCEANAAGVPVLASKSGGIPSIITNKKNGLLFNTDDQTVLCEKITYMLNNKKMLEDFSRNGLYYAEEKFDWSIVFQKHEEIFENLLNGKRTGT